MHYKQLNNTVIGGIEEIILQWNYFHFTLQWPHNQPFWLFLVVS